MTLIKSISGVRGIIYDDDLSGLSSIEVVTCIRQFSCWLSLMKKQENLRIAVGRDGRITGQKITALVIDAFMDFGFDVVNLGLTTTPSVQLAILSENCVGGIMISASHNPANWNGLKLLNFKGEFLSKKEGLQVFGYQDFDLSKQKHKKNGSVINLDYKPKHITSILNLDDVNVPRIKSRKFKIVIDGINSSGGIFIPYLLKKLGVDVIELNCVPNGHFAHNPEPLPEHLIDLCNKVKEHKADLGIAVDPDVDRLVLVSEDGSCFGEEYTLVAIAKYILSKYPDRSVVSNLSTTQAVYDIANALGSMHFESPVGEINVVELMKETNSIIGGEGSGGVIFPSSHYGRDALVGIALFLSYLSDLNCSVKELRLSLPTYFMLKEKIPVSEYFNFQHYIKNQIKNSQLLNQKFNLVDGIKVYYSCGSWSHIRMSNTEPVIRLIVESSTQIRANEIKKEVISSINNYLK